MVLTQGNSKFPVARRGVFVSRCQRAAERERVLKLIILHSNDTHGQLLPLPTEDGALLGGYARRATFIRQQREAHPHLLLLDAGDFYQGTRYWHAFQGEADIELMNHLRYDAAALGNHDADGGVAVLAARLKQAQFPVLCANMRFPAKHLLADAWTPYVIKSIGGVKVAIFSLLIDTMLLYPPKFQAAVQVTPFIEAARALISTLRQRADVLIHLSHLGHLADVELLETLNGIDLVIGGHTHTSLPEPVVVNGAPLLRSLAGGQLMGRLELEVLPGQKPQLQNYRLLPLDDSFVDDPVAAAIVEKWRQKLPPERVLGQLLTPLDTRSKIKGGGESAAGNFFADAMLAYFNNQADLSFVHMGTLRGDRIYPAGNFTNHDLSEYHPFDNTPMLMTITAPQLKIILERGVRELPFTVGAFLSPAGLRVMIDPNRPAQAVDPNHPRILFPGRRVLRAEFRGKAIDFSDARRTFNIVTDGYMGRGGAGYFTLKEAKNIRQAPVSASDVLKWYLATFSPIDPSPDGRISIFKTKNT